MSPTLRIVERARADVDQIFQGLIRRSVQGAVSWHVEFQRAVARVHAQPDGFAASPESAPLNRDLREALFKTRRGRP